MSHFKILPCLILLWVIAVSAQNPLPAQAPDAMFISRAAIALDIDDREPIDPGTVFPPEVKRLYCFTEVKNGAESEIQHRWYWKEELITTVSLRVSGNRFRTQSAKTIPPEMTGDWRVAIVNSKDESILKMLHFTIK